MPSFDNHLTPNSFIHQLSGRAAILEFTALAILPFSGKAFLVEELTLPAFPLATPLNLEANAVFYSSVLDHCGALCARAKAAREFGEN